MVDAEQLKAMNDKFATQISEVVAVAKQAHTDVLARKVALERDGVSVLGASVSTSVGS